MRSHGKCDLRIVMVLDGGGCCGASSEPEVVLRGVTGQDTLDFGSGEDSLGGVADR